MTVIAFLSFQDNILAGLFTHPDQCHIFCSLVFCCQFVALKQVFNKDKTCRTKRKLEPGTQCFELHKRADASLNSGVDLKVAKDLHDWVAVHVVDFFNRINLIYGTVCEFCTDKSCGLMAR